jgi:hypothetical protein
MSKMGKQRCSGLHALDKIEQADAVADGAEHRVAVSCEDQITLLVHASAQVRELRKQQTHGRRTRSGL